MTDKITLELTLDELKLIDKYVELNDETQSVFDKIKVAYPQPQINLQQEGEYAIVSYNDKTYYRLQSDVTFSWYIKKSVSVTHPAPTLVMVYDAETERLLEGLYYNHIQVKKEKEQQTKKSVEEAYKDWWGQYPETGTWDGFDDKRWQGFQAGYEFAWAIAHAKKVVEEVQEEQQEEDYPYKKYTPEETEQSLKQAFREAVKQGVVSSADKPTDDGLIDKLVNNPPEFLKFELGKTLEDICMRWWEDIFSINSSWDSETTIQDLCDRIFLWLPKEQDASGSQNTYAVAAVEGFNDAIKKIKSKLHNKKDT